MVLNSVGEMHSAEAIWKVHRRAAPRGTPPAHGGSAHRQPVAGRRDPSASRKVRKSQRLIRTISFGDYLRLCRLAQRSVPNDYGSEGWGFESLRARRFSNQDLDACPNRLKHA